MTNYMYYYFAFIDLFWLIITYTFILCDISWTQQFFYVFFFLLIKFHFIEFNSIKFNCISFYLFQIKCKYFILFYFIFPVFPAVHYCICESYLNEAASSFINYISCEFICLSN